MPQGTRVHRCVKKVSKSKKYNKGSALAICQASTKQSYATGKKLTPKQDTEKLALKIRKMIKELSKQV